MRKPIVAGNWKMNKGPRDGARLARAVLDGCSGVSAEIVLCPPFVTLPAVSEIIAGSDLGLGAQDLFWRLSGAYTAQISPEMLQEVGVSHVIIGHSERRGRFGVPEEGFTPAVLALFGETDQTINLKLHAALRAGFIPIVCVGETLAERQAGTTDQVVATQIEAGTAGLSPAEAGRIVLAYEPVWAIGTGETCAAAEAQRVCAHIRTVYGRLYGEDAAAAVRIQYGGSVKPDNAADLLGRPDIDGALVGGASLKADDFLSIARAAG